MLGVFDAPAEIVLVRMRVECFLVNIQHFAVGAIANGVDAELETVSNGDIGSLANRFHFFGVDAAAGGEIGIWFEHPSAAGPQSAVGDSV